MEQISKTLLLPSRPLLTLKFHQLKNYYLRNSLRTPLHHLSQFPPPPPSRGKSYGLGDSPQAITQIPFFYPPPGVQEFQVVVTLTLPNMVLSIPVWYLHPPVMVPQPSLPPQIEGIPMQILVQAPTTPPSPPTIGTTATVGGR
jgi:hypothetical protein